MEEMEGEEEGEVIDLQNLSPEELQQLIQEHPELAQQLMGAMEFDEGEDGDEGEFGDMDEYEEGVMYDDGEGEEGEYEEMATAGAASHAEEQGEPAVDDV